MLWKKTRRTTRTLPRTPFRQQVERQGGPKMDATQFHRLLCNPNYTQSTETLVPASAVSGISRRPRLRLETPHDHVSALKPLQIDAGLEVVPRPSNNLRERIGMKSRRMHLPEEILDIDRKIAELGGWTTTLEDLPENLELSKTKTPRTQKAEIDELTRQVGYLRQEIMHLKTYRAAFLRLQHKTQSTMGMLQETLTEVNGMVAEANTNTLQYWQSVSKGSRHLAGQT